MVICAILGCLSKEQCHETSIGCHYAIYLDDALHLHQDTLHLQCCINSGAENPELWASPFLRNNNRWETGNRSWLNKITLSQVRDRIPGCRVWKKKKFRELNTFFLKVSTFLFDRSSILMDLSCPTPSGYAIPTMNNEWNLYFRMGYHAKARLPGLVLTILSLRQSNL